MFGLTKEELRILKQLDRPWKIQDFLERIPINFEQRGDTCLSPRRVLRERRAHCIEAAMLGALALRIHGHPPLVIDLEAAPHDDSHVIAVFRINQKWGALSKSNHSVLRYREPIYATIRELVVSYFHEYTDPKGRKTLRSYSQPVNLSRFDPMHWMTTDEPLWHIAVHLVNTRHTPLLSRSDIRNLRRADPIERRASELLQWKPTNKH